MGFSSRSSLLGYRQTKTVRFVKVVSLYCHRVMPREDVFPRNSSLKSPPDLQIQCPLLIYNWRYGDLAKLHSHVIMTSPATECNCFMGSFPRASCTYYLNLMTSDYQKLKIKRSVKITCQYKFLKEEIY